MANMTSQTTDLTTEISEEELDSSYIHYCENYPEYFVCLPKPEDEKLWILITELIIHTIVAVLGVVGNSLAIVVLSKDKSSSSTNTILRSLAVCDIISLLLAVLYNFSKNYIYYYTENSAYNIDIALALARTLIYFIVPMQNAAVYGSHVITVMVTIDRYIAVCKPMVIRRKKQVYITLAALTVYVMAYNVPLCFEYIVLTYAGIYRENFHLNHSVPVVGIHRRDSWNSNIGYQVGYHVVLTVLLRDIGPIILIVLFNIRLHLALVNMRERYRKMRRGSNRPKTKRHMSNSESMTKTIVIVVATYTLLTLPSLILKLLTAIRQIAHETQSTAMFNSLRPVIYSLHYQSISNLLISVASSANFIIYIIFARKFKRIFVEIFCSCGMMRNKFEDVLLSNSSEAIGKANSNMAGPLSKVQPMGHSMDVLKKEHNSMREIEPTRVSTDKT